MPMRRVLFRSVSVMHNVRTETPYSRDDRLAGLRMSAEFARKRYIFYSVFKRDFFHIYAFRQAGRFGFRATLDFFSELDIRAESSDLYEYGEIGFRVVSDGLVGFDLFAFHRKRPHAVGVFLKRANYPVCMGSLTMEGK